MSVDHTGPEATGSEPQLRLLRRPWISDPIFWLGTVVGVLLGVVAVWTSARAETGFAQIALAGLFSAAVWWAIATFVPAGIRLLIARRSRAALLERRPTESEPGWYPDPTDLTRYRWWNGSEWGREVNPAPPTRQVGTASLVVLGVAAAVVVSGSLLLTPAPVNPTASTEMDAATAEGILDDLQSNMPDSEELQDGLASQFPSPSPEPSAAFDAKLAMDLAKAYGRMTDAIYKANDLSSKPGDTPADLVLAYSRKTGDVSDEWKKFNRILGQVRTQEQIGEFPPLELLRRVEGAVSRYVRTTDQISRSLFICLTVSESEMSSCIDTSRAMYEGDATRQFAEVGDAIKALADAREGQQS